MTENKDFTIPEGDSYTTPLAKERIKRAKRRMRRRRAPKSKAFRTAISLLVLILVFLLAFSVGSWLSKLIFSSPEEKNPEVQESISIANLQNKLSELTETNKALTEANKKLTEEKDFYKSRSDEYEKRFGPLTDFQYTSPRTSSENSPTTEAFASESTPPEG